MDTEKMTQNHVSYIFSKEVILKGLLEQGIIADTDFERYDQMLYDRYHIDVNLGLPRPVVENRIEDTPQSRPAADRTASAGGNYVSLTDAAREINPESPGYVVQSWLRDGNTIAFLRCWELKNNPSFNDAGYHALVEEMKSPSMTLTAKKWIDATAAIGLQSKSGKGGGTSAHPEIALAFRAWLYPEFQYALIQSYIVAGCSQERGEV